MIFIFQSSEMCSFFPPWIFIGLEDSSFTQYSFILFRGFSFLLLKRGQIYNQCLLIIGYVACTYVYSWRLGRDPLPKYSEWSTNWCEQVLAQTPLSTRPSSGVVVMNWDEFLHPGAFPTYSLNQSRAEKFIVLNIQSSRRSESLRYFYL